MKRWTLIVLSLGMTLVFSQSGLMAKGGRGQGDGLGRGHATGRRSRGRGLRHRGGQACETTLRLPGVR